MHASREICGYTLLTLLYVARKDGVDLSMYANGAILALVVTNDGLHDSCIRCDKGVQRLRATYGRDEHLNNKKQYTINTKT